MTRALTLAFLLAACGPTLTHDPAPDAGGACFSTSAHAGCVCTEHTLGEACATDGVCVMDGTPQCEIACNADGTCSPGQVAHVTDGACWCGAAPPTCHAEPQVPNPCIAAFGDDDLTPFNCANSGYTCFTKGDLVCCK